MMRTTNEPRGRTPQSSTSVTNRSAATFRCVSLFSGAGGFDIGFGRGGCFQTIACLDADLDCVATLRANKGKSFHSDPIPAGIHLADLTSPKEALRDYVRERIDVVYGGPPCQSFSVCGKRRGVSDQRGELVWSFLASVKLLKPRAFVLENVPGLATIDSGAVLKKILHSAEKLGYRCWHGKLCAADFGDATVRVRYFIIATNVSARPPAPPMPTHASRLLLGRGAGSPKTNRSLLPHVTVSEALAGLPPPDGSVNAHTAVRHHARVAERFALLLPGERDEARRRNRLRADAPSLTLFVGGTKGKKQARTHIHPTEPRELTPRECARLHSFPDSWHFVGPQDSVLTQVANSVPVQLSTAIARAVGQCLEGGLKHAQ
jgi:DNA (cytosine-5)-methyltransferase 1